MTWKALCTAAEDWSAVARLQKHLRKAGCRVTALAHPLSHLGLSRYTDELIRGSWDAAANLDILKDLLERGERYDWIILGDDRTLREAAKRKGEAWLESWYPANPRTDAISALVSKSAFSRAMKESGVATPPSVPASCLEEALAAGEKVGFPVIVKPDHGWGGTGMYFADSADELSRGFPAGPGDYLIEKRVEGRIGATVVLFDRGRPAWWFSTIKATTWPGPCGPSTSRRFVDMPGMEDVLRAMGAKLGLRAICSVDWIQPKEGETPLLLELNGRPAPFLSMGSYLGVDLSEAIRDMLSGRRTTVRPPQAADAREFHAFPRAFSRAIDRGEWARFARLATGLAGPVDIPWDDPGPLAKGCVEFAKGVAISAAEWLKGKR